jgi:hypothetical protein
MHSLLAHVSDHTADPSNSWNFFKKKKIILAFSSHFHVCIHAHACTYRASENALNATQDVRLSPRKDVNNIFSHRCLKNVRNNAHVLTGASKEDRLETEKVLKQAFDSLPSELQGTYYPLGELNDEKQEELQSGGFLFQKPGPMQLLGAAGMYVYMYVCRYACVNNVDMHV